jgi:hypothetical protein
MKCNEMFPTPAERTLWQIACCISTIGGLPIILLGIPGFSKKWINIDKYGETYFHGSDGLMSVVKC